MSSTQRTRRAAIVGSGPAGIATASTLLERGWCVDIFDGGAQPGADIQVLRESLLPQMREGRISHATERALRWGAEKPSVVEILGRIHAQSRGGIDPGVIRKKSLGSDFAFAGLERWSPLTGGFLPQSLSVGGLSRVWGAACYALREEDYIDWPLQAGDLDVGYIRAQALLGFDQSDDELARVYPLYGSISDWSDWNAHGLPAALLRHWRMHAGELNRRGVHYGRSRLAVERREQGDQGCIQCGLCLYGCARNAIWSADQLLPNLVENSRCRHFPGNIVWCLQERGNRSWLDFASGVSLTSKENGYDATFLAAGPLSSFRIAAESLGHDGVTSDLLDSDVLVVPFLPRVRRSSKGGDRFGLSELVLSFDAGTIGNRPAHMQLYEFSGPMAGVFWDLLLCLPAPLKSLAMRLLDRLVIGVLYLNSDDSRSLKIRLGPAQNEVATLALEPGEEKGVDPTKKLWPLLREMSAELGMRPLERQATLLPPGFSCHIAGTLPMRETPGLLHSGRDGRVNGFERLYAVDASVFPNLPAQNSTYTIMANAIRVAELAANE